jgi:hypothetical protein
MNEISPALGTIITANNYLHDVATGILLVSFGAIWYLSRCFGQGNDPETSRLYLSLYATVTRIAKFSLIWIILGGVPRTIYYTRLEWAPAAGDAQIVAIVIKHVVVFAALGTAVYHWIKFSKQARRVRQELTQ